MKKRSIDPASLRHLITILRTDLKSDSPWQAEAQDVIVGSVWAAVNVVSAKQESEAEQLTNQTFYEMTIRYRSDLKGQLSLLFDGSRFDILSINDPDMRKDWLVLKAKRKLGQ